MELFIGAIVSVVVELIKKVAKLRDWVVIALVVGVSIVASCLYGYFVAINLWDKVLPILFSAAGIYALIIKRFEK